MVWNGIVACLNGALQIFNLQVNFGLFTVSFYQVIIAVMVGCLGLYVIFKLFEQRYIYGW